MSERDPLQRAGIVAGCLMCWLEERELKPFWQEQGAGRQLNVANSFMEEDSEYRMGWRSSSEPELHVCLFFPEISSSSCTDLAGIFGTPLSGVSLPDDDPDAGQGSKFCLVAIGRLQVRSIVQGSALS